MNSPCYECPNRKLGCRTDCEPFLKYEEMCKEIRKKRAEESGYQAYTANKASRRADNRHVLRCQKRGFKRW